MGHTVLLDANLLIALVVADHVHHDAAREVSLATGRSPTPISYSWREPTGRSWPASIAAWPAFMATPWN